MQEAASKAGATHGGSPRARRIAAAALLALFAGCGAPEAPRAVLHDLAVELPLLAASGPPATLATAAGGVPALRLPAGGTLSTVAELDGPALFEHGGWRAVGDARLEILAGLEDAAARPLVTGAAGAPAGTLALPGSGRRLVAVELRATGSGEIVLLRPRVLGRAAAAPPEAPAAAAQPQRPNVLFVLVDTLRRDRLGIYGCPRGLTPRIDAFASTSTVFDETVAQASWTRPSVTSIFTGLFPQGHGVTGLETSLAPEATTLAELLRGAGYFTAAVSTNYHVTKETGLRQGFERFALIPEAIGSDVVRKGLELLAARPATDARPYLLYLHLLDPHAPYAPPADLRQRFAPDVRAKAGSRRDLGQTYAAHGRRRVRRIDEIHHLYDGEVAAVDRAFGELLDGLTARALLRDTLVVLVSDHGEEFDEHGMLGHGNTLHSEVLDIPLVVRFPGQTLGARRADLAQHVDLLPTLLGAAGIAVPSLPLLPGRDLATPAAGERAAFSHLRYNGKELVSVQLGGFKLVVPKEPAGPARLYDHRADPGELEDIAGRSALRTAYLLQHLRAFELGSRTGLDPERAQLPDEAIRALRALGYF